MLPIDSPYVLLVDDDYDLRIVTSLALQEKIKVVSVPNGLEAIKTLVVGLRHNNLPCLIFLDLNMPLFNGWEVLELMDVAQPKIRDIPVVVTSGEERSPDAKYRFRLIRKPYSISDLVNEIELARCQ